MDARKSIQKQKKQNAFEKLEYTRYGYARASNTYCRG